MIGPLKKRNRLLKIFLSTLYLSAFTFGGGYVIITLMKQKFVDELHWIDDDEMLDMVAIAQSSPGPIAVNGAVIIGYKLEGIAGAEGQANFTLAPNPARGNVTLTLTGVPAQGTTLTLHDAAGREVLRRTLSEQHTTIPTAELPAGVYTVTVSGPQGSSVRRLVIE